ncbi:MAG: nicotinate (nicotinamide) nucleotide adenylyltransferase [Bacteroidales bacterium]|nr:nicotinate (nicotinamide) nucleotide adenylyltransferase [Bacteroidales bacterium]
MRTAIYSGSFNPLHIGHLAIMKHMTEDAGFDCVYLIVSPKNPLKEGISSATGPERYRSAVEAVARHPELKVKVDDIELTMEEPHYTIRTLDALREREPGNAFTLVIGADNLASIRRWRDYSRILAEYGVAVFPRTGFDLEQIKADLLQENPEFKITLLKAEMVDISSTTIREALASGQDPSAWLM